MKVRYRIQNTDLLIGAEAEFSDAGVKSLAALRRADKRFRARRIYGMIQAEPDKIPLTEDDGKRSKVFHLI